MLRYFNIDAGVLVFGVFLITSGMGSMAFAQNGVRVIEKGYVARMEAEKKAAVQRKILMSRQAQQDKDMSVLTRKQPEYNALNIMLGNLAVSPSLTSSVSYVDNIYETQNNTVKDFIFTNLARIGIKSDFLRHAFDADLSFEDAQYQDRGDESYHDYKIYLGARLDVTDQWKVPLGFTQTREHTKRSDPEDRAGIAPTIFEETKFQSGLRYAGYLIDIAYNTIVSKLLYRNNVSSSGVEIDNSDRDRTEMTHNLTFGLSEAYEISPIAYVGVKTVQYDAAVDNFNIDRDSAGWDAGIGLRMNLSGVTSSTIKIGRVHRNFDDPSLASVDVGIYGIDLIWEPSSLMAVSLAGGRYVDETSLSDASASVNSSLGLGITYELAPNIYVYPDIQYLIKDYRASDNREITRLTSGVDFVYKANRNIWGTLSLENATQNEERSAVPQTESSTNTIILSVKLQI